jgi:hypothetical protein
MTQQPGTSPYAFPNGAMMPLMGMPLQLQQPSFVMPVGMGVPGVVMDGSNHGVSSSSSLSPTASIPDSSPPQRRAIDDMPDIIKQYDANPTAILDLGAEYSKEIYHSVKVHKTTPGIPDSLDNQRVPNFRHKLFQWIRTCPHELRELRLVGCNIGDVTLMKNVLKALQYNDKIYRVDLTNNNISCRTMLLFIDRLEPYNYTITKLTWTEGSKTLAEKGRNVHDAWGKMIGDLVINEEEVVLEAKYVQPRIERFLEWNRKRCSVRLCHFFIALRSRS